MSATGYQVKVYYIENKATKEIRKFTIEQDVAANYEYLSAKIRRVFPGLLRKDIEIFWKDDEDDFLTISSNEELVCAWEGNEESSGIIKLFVKEKQQHQSGCTGAEEKEHPGIICEGCNSKVKGIRYKCTKCNDFDLCSKCESKDKHPSDHELLCIKLPRGTRRCHPEFSQRYFRRGHGPQMFCGPSPFSRFGYFGDQRKRYGEGKFQTVNTKKSCFESAPVDEKLMGETIGNLATCFGLDPEVAKCYFVSFTDDLKAKQKKEKLEEKKENPEEKANDGDKKEEREEGCEDISSLLATAFGVQEELVKRFLDPFIPKHTPTQDESSSKEDAEQQQQQKEEDKFVEQKMETEEEESHEVEKDVDFKVDDEDNEEKEDDHQTSEESSKKKDQTKTPSSSQKSQTKEENTQFKQEIDNMVRNFSDQFGLPSSAQGNIQGGLESLLHGMFNFQQQQKANDFKKDEEQRKSDDFVFVDGSKTKEEQYQNKLKESLERMLAMGFDNDGGWLEQLLVSKQLSIDRVLEALSPSEPLC